MKHLLLASLLASSLVLAGCSETKQVTYESDPDPQTAPPAMTPEAASTTTEYELGKDEAEWKAKVETRLKDIRSGLDDIRANSAKYLDKKGKDWQVGFERMENEYKTLDVDFKTMKDSAGNRAKQTLDVTKSQWAKLDDRTKVLWEDMKQDFEADMAKAEHKNPAQPATQPH